MRESRWLPTVLVGAAAAALAVLLTWDVSSVITPLIYVATMLVLVVSRRRLAPIPLSPVWIIVLVFAATGILGELLHNRVAGAGGASIRVPLTDDLSTITGRLFAVSALVVALAGALVGRGGPAPATIGETRLRSVRPSPNAQGWLWVFAVLPAAMLASGGNFGRLIERADYLNETQASSFAAFGGQLAMAAAAVLGLLLAIARPAGRVFAVLLLGVYMTYYFASGSRRMALIPVLVAIGYCSVKMSKRAVGWLTASGVVAFVLMGVPLYLRDLSTHGLKPYLAAMPDYLGTSTGWATITNNVIVSFPITGAVAYAQPPIPLHVLGIQLSPLPGGWTDWYDWLPVLRLNFYTPYSAIGELGNYGWVVLVAVLAGVGCIAGYLDRRVRTLMGSGQHVVALALVGLAALFAVFCLQYDLRAASRMLLYAIVLDVAARIILPRIRSSGPGRQTPAAAYGPPPRLGEPYMGLLGRQN
jgi:hypothetical protein